MNEITTRTEHMSIDEGGFIRCKAFKYSEHTLEDAKENINAVKQLAQGRKVAVLVDISEVKGADREAREYLSSPEAGKIQSACALIVGSAVSRLVGNFFLGLNKTPFPTKLFTDEAKAVEWLKTFI
jgi:hypothetical protein